MEPLLCLVSVHCLRRLSKIFPCSINACRGGTSPTLVPPSSPSWSINSRPHSLLLYGVWCTHGLCKRLGCRLKRAASWKNNRRFFKLKSRCLQHNHPWTKNKKSRVKNGSIDGYICVGGEGQVYGRRRRGWVERRQQAVALELVGGCVACTTDDPQAFTLKSINVQVRCQLYDCVFNAVPGHTTVIKKAQRERVMKIIDNL